VRIIESGSLKAWGIEVFLADVSKRLGLEALAARLGLDRSEIMAIGDHMNDIEMLAWAGLGVAMGNALPEVQAVADVVTTHVEEDGVAEAIERFVLQDRRRASL
jgi:hydroxymethylpyrimidine pyrophosphatase-like HAD family hydrolase